jgi:hypothetical protein
MKILEIRYAAPFNFYEIHVKKFDFNVFKMFNVFKVPVGLTRM